MTPLNQQQIETLLTCPGIQVTPSPQDPDNEKILELLAPFPHLKIGAIYENWRSIEEPFAKKMFYAVTDIRMDRTKESLDLQGIRVSYQGLYPGGTGGDRSVYDFLELQDRKKGEKRSTDPEHNGLRFLHCGQLNPEQIAFLDKRIRELQQKSR